VFIGAALVDVLEAVELEIFLLLEVVVEAPLVPWRREIRVEVEELRVEVPPDRTEPLAAAKVEARIRVEPICVLVVGGLI